MNEQFLCLGIDLPDEVLKRCGSLCEDYNVDAEEFVERWMAFSLSNLNGASPNIDQLNLFERKEFSKRAAVNVPARVSTITESLRAYGGTETSLLDEDDIAAYIEVPKENKTDEVTSKGVSLSVRETCSAYASRAHAGDVIQSFGDEALLAKFGADEDAGDVPKLVITEVANEDDKLCNRTTFGHDILCEKVTKFDEHISHLSIRLKEKHKISELSSVRKKSQTDIYIAGRIECDSDSRLNAKSVMLQGNWDHSMNETVQVNIDHVPQYSLFSGQIVIMKGINPRGTKFMAQEVICDAAKPIPKLTAPLEGTLSLVIASGPYTASNNLDFEPLKDFLKYVREHKPNVALMIGPFIDSDHPVIKATTLDNTYNDLFEKVLRDIVEVAKICSQTQFYLVSSSRDAFHMFIYPTPPYHVVTRQPNLHMVSDPSTLNINGVTLSVTSTDILMYINQEEINHNMGGDKLSRFAGHVIKQACMYPTYPPPLSVPLDATLWANHAKLNDTPHILVLPSSYRYFIKEVHGSIVINPAFLTKGVGGGTFARVLITADETGEGVKIATQIKRI